MTMHGDGLKGGGGTISTYEGGRITFDDGTENECNEITTDQATGYDISYLGCY